MSSLLWTLDPGAAAGRWEEASGGGLQPGTVLPVGEQQVTVTVDETTYDNAVTGGKLRTLVFDGEGAALGIAQLGDAFPRILLTSDGEDGLYMADGTVDPYTNSTLNLCAKPEAGGYSARLGGNSAEIVVGVDGGNRGTWAQSSNPFVIQGVGIIGYGGDPNGNVGGEVNDLCLRQDAPDVNHYFYRCTVAGDAASATWVPVGGLT